MSVHSNPPNLSPDPKHIHQLVLQRLYHEDLLLTQRTYNFLTFNVFLGTLLVIGGVSQGTLNSLGIFVGVLGAAVATIQTAFGRRIEKAITFWREYAGIIERNANLPVDHLLFDYYAGGVQNGEVRTPWGSIIRKEPCRPAMYQTWPWSWMPSTNTAIGVLLPFFIGTVWLLALIVTFVKGHKCFLAWIPGIYWLALFIFAWFYPLPATPKGVHCERVDF